jgi:hypothetical protein
MPARFSRAGTVKLIVGTMASGIWSRSRGPFSPRRIAGNRPGRMRMSTVSRLRSMRCAVMPRFHLRFGAS